MSRETGFATAGGLSVSLLALLAAAAPAFAGGFAVREQSTEFQGESFAGSAAGGALSSMFWNPAAAAYGTGLNTESNYSFVVPRSEITTTSVSGPGTAAPVPGLGGATFGQLYGADTVHDSGDIGHWAVVPASYGSYQLSKDLFLGVGINSGFGLTTKPENLHYQAATLGQTTKLSTYNLNPTLAYRIAPGITIGGGVQIEAEKGTLRFATGIPQGPTTSFEGTDVAFGGTAGILFEPAAGTSIGVGYRSQITHTLEGSFTTTQGAFLASADIKQPDIVTVSLRQAVATNARLLGTFEWSNWSRFDKVQVVSTVTGAALATLNTNWGDGYMLAAGGEYDYSPKLTLRTGVSYEWSPIQNASERILQVPDADRFTISGGASYHWTDTTTLSFAYSHLFVADSSFTQTTIGVPITIAGNVQSSIDIVSVGYSQKW